MTHQTERVPFLAKYPIDKWEAEGKPLMTEEGWCEFVMRVAQGKLDTLDAVFQAAQKTRTRLRTAKGMKDDDVEEIRQGMVALKAAPEPAEEFPAIKDELTLQLVLRLRGDKAVPPPEPKPGAPCRASGNEVM